MHRIRFHIHMNRLVLTTIFTAWTISTCPASEFPKWIRTIQSSDAATRKRLLPRAYYGYAMEFLQNKAFKQAEKQMEKAISIASFEDNRNIYRPQMANVLYYHALNTFHDRKVNDHLHRASRKLAERALVYNAKHVKAHTLIGDIAYENQDFQSAKVAWLRAQSFEPQNSSIQERLARAEQEKSVEKNFGRESHGFFDVRFQKGIRSKSAVDLRRYLEVARKQVGRDFRYFPQHKLVVLVYTPAGFRAIKKGKGQDWWAAYYDGKIRIPMPVTAQDVNALKPTLVHEYTHALVHDLARQNCPRWLNEGLAEYQESKIRQPPLEVLRLATRLHRLIPLSELSENLIAVDHGQVALAYLQSYSLVTFIEERYGFDRINRLLDDLAEGAEFEAAFSKRFATNLTFLEQDWNAWLKKFVSK